MSTVEIRKYITDAGTCPYDDAITGFRDTQALARITARVQRLTVGLFGDCKPVGAGVLELRIDHGPGYRVYFGRRGASLVVLLIAGDKRTQAADIVRAKDYWNDCKKRESGKDA